MAVGGPIHVIVNVFANQIDPAREHGKATQAHGHIAG